jgi:hypothetical protein
VSDSPSQCVYPVDPAKHATTPEHKTPHGTSTPRRTVTMRTAWRMLAVLGLLSRVSHASAGDRSHEFRDCVQVCKDTNCGRLDPAPIRWSPVPPSKTPISNEMLC